MHRSHSMVSERPRLLNYDTREMILTARLYETEGLRLGDRIYIIDKDPDHRKYKNGYIVGQAEIFSIFETEFQGWMMKARGNFSMVGANHFIARERNSSQRAEAWAMYKKGDQQESAGDYAGAYASFRKSYDSDPQKPETWMRLGLLADRAGRETEARQYIRGAWERLNRFQDTEDVLRLPGLYLEKELSYLHKNIFPADQRLKSYLKLLKEIRDYGGKLQWYAASFSPKVLDMLRTKGLPVAQYHLFLGELYENISTLLSANAVEKVVRWLNAEERKILYTTISLPYQNKSNMEPTKMWDEAFLQSAFYHYRLANELDRLDTRSAYKLILLSANQLKTESLTMKKDTYRDILKYYSREFLAVPGEPAQMARVRNLLNTADQL